MSDTYSMTSKQGIVAALCSAAVVLVALGALGSYAAYLKRSAESIRNDLTSLTVGRSTYADVLRLREKHSRFLWPHSGGWSRPTQLYNGPDFSFSDTEPCRVEKCAVTFRIDNAALAKFRVVSPALFGGRVAVLDGKVAAVELELLGGPFGSSGGIVDYTDCCPKFPRSVPYDFPTPVGKPYLLVSFSNAATDVQRQHAFDLSMRCLVARSDCNRPCEYLPQAWRDYAAEVAKLGMATPYWTREFSCGQ